MSLFRAVMFCLGLRGVDSNRTSLDYQGIGQDCNMFVTVYKITSLVKSLIFPEMGFTPMGEGTGVLSERIITFLANKCVIFPPLYITGTVHLLGRSARSFPRRGDIPGTPDHQWRRKIMMIMIQYRSV